MSVSSADLHAPLCLGAMAGMMSMNAAAALASPSEPARLNIAVSMIGLPASALNQYSAKAEATHVPLYASACSADVRCAGLTGRSQLPRPNGPCNPPGRRHCAPTAPAGLFGWRLRWPCTFCPPARTRSAPPALPQPCSRTSLRLRSWLVLQSNAGILHVLAVANSKHDHHASLREHKSGVGRLLGSEGLEQDQVGVVTKVVTECGKGCSCSSFAAERCSLCR